jgi:hypothetical protein
MINVLHVLVPLFWLMEFANLAMQTVRRVHLPMITQLVIPALRLQLSYMVVLVLPTVVIVLALTVKIKEVHRINAPNV